MNISQLRKRMLEAGVAVPAIALMGAGFAAPAYAQDEADATCDPSTQQCDEPVIVVTGSILQRSTIDTPSPVTSLNTESLENRGINTVAEAVQRVAANGSGTIAEGWNNGSNFATGANAISLRGLTVQKTLTLFDGLRMAPYPLADDGHRNFVDMNTIPDAIVERIDIQKDGASSTYGADAVAGVVNIITRREIQGIQANGSYGFSQEGDADEIRLDATAGYGDLDDQGFNVYVTGMYRKNDALFARDRQHPFNTSNLSQICTTPDSAGRPRCMVNGVQFGSNADGSLSAGTTTVAPLVAPATAAGGRLGQYQLLNPDCSAYGLSGTTLTDFQRRGNSTTAAYTWAANQCLSDLRNEYSTLRPETERWGVALRGTIALGDDHEAYFSGQYMSTNTFTQASPLAYNNQTTPPGAVLLNPLVLPVYVCAAGTATFTAGGVNQSAGCTAANGTLNPYNPFAAGGQNAILRGRYDRPREITADTRVLRGAAGVKGTFGGNDEWNYQADFTASNVQLTIEQANYLIPQRIADVAARGNFNFRNPSLTPEMRDYIAPLNSTTSNSDLWQAQLIVGRDLFELPGGMMEAAVGASYRQESIDNPSANPEDIAHPYDRYYGVNAVGAIGSRNVKSGFFEIGAPIIDSLAINVSGRYDKYSTGQENFSPKIGATFEPIEEVMFRGTWSKGFRIPSFNESFGLPTTGYATSTINCATYAAFCAAHTPPGGSPNGYATAPYSIGRTATGNPSLDPEKSTSWTAGVIVRPMRNVTLSLDYFNIKVKNIIGGLGASTLDEATSQYYLNNGVVNIPGIVVRPQTADAQFPNALPLLGFIEYSFQNDGEERVQGLDFGADIRMPMGPVDWTSSFDGSYVLKYELERGDGTVERYDGTLSPCDYTSCSGSPSFRATWANTFEYDRFALTTSIYYTSAYDLAAIDYGAELGDCQAGIVNGETAGYKVPVGSPAGTAAVPVKCEVEATWNVDMTAAYQVNDNIRLYVNVLNVLDIHPPFDPSGAYQLTQYNPAWAQPNIMGRYFRFGARFQF